MVNVIANRKQVGQAIWFILSLLPFAEPAAADTKWRRILGAGGVPAEISDMEMGCRLDISEIAAREWRFRLERAGWIRIYKISGTRRYTLEMLHFDYVPPGENPEASARPPLIN